MIDPIEGERALSEVAASGEPWLTARRKLLLAGTALAGLFAFIVWRDPGGRRPDPDPDSAARTAGIGQDVAYDAAKPVAMTVPVEKPVVTASPSATPAASAVSPGAGTALPEPRPFIGAFPAGPPHRPPRMLSYAVAAGGGRDPARGVGGGDPGPAPGTGGGAAGTRVVFKGSEIAGGKAGPALNKTLTLMPGIIRCILDTAINSTVAGPLLCHLDQPIISDGGVVLMEKGTQVIGSYSADARQSQYRMSAVTATAYTPNGVPVPLGGQFADDLGVTGLEADNVNNHVWQRIGGAVMLSFAEGGMGVLQAAVSKAGNSYVSFSNGGTGSIAQQLLQSTINIPPTITKNQGDPISLWIMTPIDFSASYKLRSIN